MSPTSRHPYVRRVRTLHLLQVRANPRGPEHFNGRIHRAWHCGSTSHWLPSKVSGRNGAPYQFPQIYRRYNNVLGSLRPGQASHNSDVPICSYHRIETTGHYFDTCMHLNLRVIKMLWVDTTHLVDRAGTVLFDRVLESCFLLEQCHDSQSAEREAPTVPGQLRPCADEREPHQPPLG